MIADEPFFMVETDETLLDLEAVFGNSNPVYIEIGSGKGEFISGYPKFHPEWNFLGFELRGKRIHNCLRKLDPASNPNVRLVERFVDTTITQFLPANSIAGAFIQHPDPWPKDRHKRRRLIQQDLLNALASVLIPGALVQVSTDHQEYADWIVKEFLASPHFTSIHNEHIQEQPNLDAHVVTWYEREQARMGYPPNYMLFKKI